ncbi:MAG: hypothetical protein RR615_07875 [Morganella sp. (in: enterobacteria)]
MKAGAPWMAHLSLQGCIHSDFSFCPLSAYPPKLKSALPDAKDIPPYPAR